MKKPTLIDVGREAGVSAITVSRALRQPEKVSDSMRAKVQAAVKKLGYVPDVAAATLASKRSNIIGMLVPSFSNTVFADVLAGAYEAIRDTNFTIQIGNVQYSALTEESLLPGFLNLKPAGLIVAGIDQTATARELLRGAPCPIVQIMDLDPDPIDMIVGFSHIDGAAAAVDHMVAQGFRRIGFLGARMDSRTQKRLAGYRSVLEARGLYDEVRVMTTPAASSVAIGGHLLADLLTRAPDCDAIFCNNDDIAIGAAFECQRRAIRIPDDLGICGFNDLGITAQMHPPITSVFTPRFEIGKRAVEMIGKTLSGDLGPEEKRIDLGFELRPRASTVAKWS